MKRRRSGATFLKANEILCVLSDRGRRRGSLIMFSEISKFFCIFVKILVKNFSISRKVVVLRAYAPLCSTRHYGQ